MGKLQGKVAIVVGGGGAIGGAIAAKLSAEGARIAVIDMMDYGMMKGDAVLDKALKLLE